MLRGRWRRRKREEESRGRVEREREGRIGRKGPGSAHTHSLSHAYKDEELNGKCGCG
jgi:hypothetical protein